MRHATPRALAVAAALAAAALQAASGTTHDVPWLQRGRASRLPCCQGGAAPLQQRSCSASGSTHDAPWLQRGGAFRLLPPRRLRSLRPCSSGSDSPSAAAAAPG
jgi:hypothetical protein